MSATRKSIQPELSPRGGGDEAKRDAVEEQAGGDPGAPEQALGAALGRGFEARTGAAGYRRVEVLPGVKHLDEKLPRRLTVARVALADREVGAEGLAVVREGKLQLGRNGSLLRARVPVGREAPVEDGGGELAEVGDAGLRAARGVERALADAAGETVLPLRVLPVQDRPAFASAGAETTKPFGWMKPSHSRWARALGSGSGMFGVWPTLPGTGCGRQGVGGGRPSPRCSRRSCTPCHGDSRRFLDS